MPDLKKVSVKLHQDKYEIIETIAGKRGVNLSEVIRNLIDKGLEERVLEENTDLIAQIVRQQLDIVLKPHVERLAKLSSKSGHMAATASFLNVQALMDLVPPERKKEVRTLYESARKKAAAYMRIPAAEFENDFGGEE